LCSDRLLHGDTADDDRIARADVGTVGAWDWGPMLAARALWSEVGLDTILDNLARPNRRAAVPLSDRALVLIANPLTAPGSEHALAQWLETDFVMHGHGHGYIVGCNRCRSGEVFDYIQSATGPWIVRSASRRARRRRHPRRWFRRSPPRRPACGSSSSIPKNGRASSAAKA